MSKNIKSPNLKAFKKQSGIESYAYGGAPSPSEHIYVNGVTNLLGETDPLRRNGFAVR